MEQPIGKKFSPLLIFCFLPSAIFFTPSAFSQSQGTATQKNLSGDLPEGNTASQQKDAENHAAGEEAANKQSAAAGAQQAQQPVEQDALAKGVELFKSGEYEKALKEFLNAQEKHPEDPDIPFFIGMAHLKLTQPEKAVPYFKGAIEKDPMDWDAYFQLGTALVALKKFDEALGCLEKLYWFQPGREDLGCLLGMACYGCGRYEDALKYLETGVNSDRMRDVTAMYTGLARKKLGKHKEARMGFREMSTVDPTSPLALPSRRLYEVLGMEEVITRPYRFSATFRTLYDDNVSLIPRVDLFNAGPKKASFGQSVFLQGEYSLLKRPKYEINVSYGLNQTVYESLNRKFDIQGHTPGMSFVHRGGQIGPIAFSPRFDYFFNYVLLNYSEFLRLHVFRPSLTLTEGSHFMTSLSYNYEMKDYRATPAFTAENPDAAANEVGLTQFLRSSDGRHYFKAGYYRRWEMAAGDDFDLDSNYFLMGVQYTFPKEVRLNADYTWEYRNFSHNNIFFGERRKDIENAIITSVSKDIGDHVTVFGEFLKRNNYSNLSLFGYEKNIFSVGISYRF